MALAIRFRAGRSFSLGFWALGSLQINAAEEAMETFLR